MSRQQKRAAGPQRRPAPAVGPLGKCAQAQERLGRAEAAATAAAVTRRDAVREAYRAGITVKELAEALNISGAKIYQLLGGVESPTA